MSRKKETPMKVKDLIKKLKKLPPNMLIVIATPKYWDEDAGYDKPIIYIENNPNPWAVLR